MSINIELMRKKLARLKGEDKEENVKNSIFFKPEEGEQDIRIVPSPDGDPLKEVFFHYDVPGQENGILCPKRNDGEKCPICEFASKLWKEGVQEDDEESKNMAKKLFVRSRYFSPIVIRGRENEGAKLYGYGKKAYEMLLGYILDPDYGDITDPESGTDISLTYRKPTKKGAYPQTNLKMRRDTSHLVSDKKLLHNILSNVPTVEEAFSENKKSPQEIEAILDAMMNAEATPEERSRETVAYNTSEVSKVEASFRKLAG